MRNGLPVVLATNGGGDRRNSDLAVAVVELGLLALVVVLLGVAFLSRLSRLHFHVGFSDPSLVLSSTLNLVAKWG